MPIFKALLAQLLAGLLIVLIVKGGALSAPLWAAALAQGIAAASLAGLLRCERWWLVIHLGFAPLAVAASRLEIAPGWYLAAFVLSALIFWSSYRTRVPLYLSNRATAAAVGRVLAGRPAGRLLDLGSGTGSLLRPLTESFPEWHFTGIESSPLPHLLARLWSRGQSNLELARGDFFAADWSAYDVVYAFLSPVPMARVWAKARAQMRPGSLLLSNSFAVPDASPDEVIEVGDRRGTRLLLYRPNSGKGGRGR